MNKLLQKLKKKKGKVTTYFFLMFLMYLISTRLKENFNPTYINIKVHFELHIRKMILSVEILIKLLIIY